MIRHAATILAAGLVLAASYVRADEARSAVSGYIYGTVETRDGATHTGVLRWDDEEAFWDDLFHSSKTELPYAEYAEDPAEDEDATWWQRMAATVGGELGIENHEGRIIAIRFGDLARVRVTGGNDAVLTLRDGREVEVGGYANDVGTPIVVLDAKPGRIEIPWKRIDTISFAATPPDADPGSFRLHGTVTTEDGELAGFVQWDNQECLSTDRLDGDRDGGRRVSLAMGEIRSIERRDRRSSRVVLKDGTEMVLDGTNDVNDDIRGIHVEVAGLGRVEVPWDEFVRVEFDDPGPSGPGYDEFAPPAHLKGTVRLDGGDWRSGRLVFDLDEEWSWEMLDGSADGIDYTVPFVRVASLERMDDGCRVRLRDGRELVLSGSHDVGADNAGIVVIPDGAGEPAHVPWRDVAAVELDR